MLYLFSCPGGETNSQELRKEHKHKKIKIKKKTEVKTSEWDELRE